MFQGLNGFLHCLENKIPVCFFWEWLRAKWIADLKTVAWAIAMLPFLVLWAVGAALMVVGAGLLNTKGFLPSWCSLPDEWREPQRQAVKAAQIYMTPPQEKTPAG